MTIYTSTETINLSKGLEDLINLAGLESVANHSLLACAYKVQLAGAEILEIKGKHFDWRNPKNGIVRRVQFRKGCEPIASVLIA